MFNEKQYRLLMMKGEDVFLKMTMAEIKETKV